MVTGRYPHQNGVMGLTHKPFAWDLDADEQHMASILSEAGWDSVLAGIHHAAREDDAYFDTVLGNNTMGSTASGAGNCLDVADRAASAIERHGASNAPLHLQVGFFEPHREPRNPSNFPEPLEPDDYNERATIPAYLVDEPSAREEFRAFEAAVERMDAGVGRVLDALDEARIADETIVIATTEHGIPFPRAKAAPYEPGLETFLLARWPDELPAGSTYEPPITTVDHLPTLFDWIDVDIPETVSGVSHADAISRLDSDNRGPASRSIEESPRQTVFAELSQHDYTDPRRTLRTERYTCIVNFSNSHEFMDPSQDHRPATITRDPEAPRLAHHPPVELYDRESDPRETDNLASDPAYAEVRTDLLGRLHEWMRRTNDPLLHGIPDPPMHAAAIASLKSGTVVEPGSD
jgi:arylsulfatase A-like enzyme